MTPRERLLRRVREAVGTDAIVPPVPRRYRTGGSPETGGVVERFRERAADYRAEVVVTGPSELAATVGDILRSAHARSLLVPEGVPASWLDALDDHVEVVRDVEGRLSVDVLDTVDAVLTGSAVSIADTGTIVLDGSPNQGRRALSLIPDRHVCVISSDDIVATVPEAIRLLEATRPLTFVSGPSATSDIELERVEGVHGPRNLHVIVVGERTAGG